ncbi:MAG: hypothetical protein LUQ09_05235 [Methanomassiliicoccales archaeon]|nr:hypothetical protein [Methanomassiliicoccales archaeon]
MKEVLTALNAFQNPDGGFGRALEMDMRSPSSSALATAIGLHTLCDLDRPAEEPMVRRAVAYLLATYQEGAGVWRVAPLDVNSYPHAPWWHDQEGSLERTFDGFRIIPRALVLAGLHHYSSLVPVDLLDRMTEETVECIESEKDLGSGGGSDLEYVIALAETRGLPERWRGRLESRVREVVPVAVVGDPERWNTYCLSPLRIIDTPETLGAELIADKVQIHLNHQIENQSEEGTWDPVWSWAGAYPDDWARARLEWRGHLTLRTLMQLRAFRRMEE